jgi:hypothetical protein
MDLIIVDTPGTQTTVRKLFPQTDVMVVTDTKDLYAYNTHAEKFDIKEELTAYDTFTIVFEPGLERLRESIASTLDDTKCWIVDLETAPWNYPSDQLAEIIKAPRRIHGNRVFEFGTLPEEPPQEAFTTGFPLLDRHGFRVVRSAFMPVIGPYGSGKSVLLRQLAVNMWKLHGWKSCFTTFEEKPARFERDFRLHMAHAMGNNVDPNGDRVSREIRSTFRGIRRERHRVMDVEQLCDDIDYACRVYGVDMVVIDPVNEVDHNVPKGMSKTDYMGEFIMKLKHLADDHNLLMICAAHPPKDSGSRRNANHLYTLNDGADTAHYGNKADIGWTVWRPDLTDGRTYLNIDKCKDVDVMGRPEVFKLGMRPTGAFEVTDGGPMVLAEILGDDQ